MREIRNSISPRTITLSFAFNSTEVRGTVAVTACPAEHRWTGTLISSLSVGVSLCVSISLGSLCLYEAVSLPFYLHLCVGLSICLSVSLCVCMSASPPVRPYSFLSYLSACTYVCQSVYTYVCLPVTDAVADGPLISLLSPLTLGFNGCVVE